MKSMPSSKTLWTAVALAVLGLVLPLQNVQAALTADQQIIENHLPAGVVLESPGIGETLATDQEIATATAAAVTDASLTALNAVAAAVSFRHSTTTLVVLEVAKASPTQSTNIVRAAFQNLVLTTADGEIVDDVAAAAAIMANTATGIQTSAASATAKKTALTNAVKEAVTRALSVKGPTAKSSQVYVPKNGVLDNKTETGNTKNDGKAPSKGAAGVVTGAVAETQIVNNLTTANKALVAAIVTAAVQKGSAYFLEISQAAATAAAYVYANHVASKVTAFDTGGGDTNIVNAAYAGLPAAKKTAANKTAITAAVKFGLGEAKLAMTNVAHMGAGAKGVLNYADNSGNPTGTAVTDITGL
jgi:hypothetical protein